MRGTGVKRPGKLIRMDERDLRTPSRARGRRRRLLHAGTVAVSLLSALLALGLQRYMGRWEAVLGDALMSARLAVFERAGTPRARQDVVLLALDNRTLEQLGRFRGGNWVARKPYADQTRFFLDYFSPSVLAYDVIFADAVGAAARAQGALGEDAERLAFVHGGLGELAAQPGSLLDSGVLADLGVLLAEQGTLLFMHGLAAALESGAYSTVAAYNFRGGYIDPQAATIPWWSEADVTGGDARGRTEYGARLPYLLDVAIPEACITRVTPAWRALDPPHNAFMPGGELLDYVRLGAINARPDRDGVVRRVPLVLRFAYRNPVHGTTHEVTVPSFSLLIALLHTGIELPLRDGAEAPLTVRLGEHIVMRPPDRPPITIPIDDRGHMLIDFDVRASDVPAVSFADAAPSYLDTDRATRDRMAAGLRARIDGNIVVVGDVSTGSTDLGPTPIGDDTPYVMVHLATLNNILNARFLRELSRWQHVCAWAVLVLLMTALSLRLRTGPLAVLTVGGMAAVLLVAYAGVHFSVVRLPVVAPWLYLGVGSFGVITLRYLVEERDRRRIRGMFETMVSSRVLSYLEDHPESFSLEGRQVEATVFFSDVVGFTSASEALSPAQVTHLMNAYLTPVSDCMMAHGAYIDKYVGDMAMAVWGAPYPQPDHAVNACLAALEQRELLRTRSPDWERAFGVAVRVRMALNSGPLIAGNMGSARKMQYTVMGDVVNVAARLEPLNRIYGTDILIGAGTRERLDARFVVQFLDRVVVKGRHTPVDVYALVGLRDAVPEATRAAIATYESAWALYAARDWDAALRRLDGLPPGDPAGEALRAQIARARDAAAAQGEAWRPVRIMEAK